MNINFSYKAQTVSIITERRFHLKRVYESSVHKFEPHFSKELQLYGTKLKLRSKHTNSILSFNDLIGETLSDNDTIIIELKQNLTASNPNIHAPKRCDPQKIDNNYSPVSYKSSDYSQMKNNVNSKTKTPSKLPYSVDIVNGEKEHRYQKSDQSHFIPKHSQNFSSPFDRTDLRRSLGADVAPQFDIPNYSANRIDNLSTTHESESSISDFSNLMKPPSNKRPVQLRNLQTKFNGFEKHNSVSKSAPASPTKPMPPPRSPHTHMSMLNTYNVRTIGNKISISLIKKPNIGLGFTIVTRDNQVQYGSAADIANSVVILVNKILPNGGAAEDNRLRPGDRLLEVNDMPVSSLKDATDKLRSISENERVNLLISRVDRFENPTTESMSPTHISSLPKKQITFEIPLNHNKKERQQLGLNIQCLEDRENPSMGSGIYIHSILANSLASQQGGLRVDDKLIGINGRSLNDTSVDETIGQLQKVMKNDSVLIITVYRAAIKDQHGDDSVMQKKEHNHSMMNNRSSIDRKNRDNTDSRTILSSSRYSSSDSLSHQNSNVHQIDPGSAFVRESKGRRSMSDKRKAHEDASQYNFYKETRIGDVSLSDDRLYSTLPTTSRLKKMSNSQSQNLSNKTQVPVKPSQIKQLNTPKSQHEQNSNLNKIPNRSISLRSSPTRLNQSALEPSQSPKHFSHTPTHDPQPGFNRSMNNSFKRAVQKSLPTNGHHTNKVNSTEKLQSIRKEVESIPQQALIENTYPIYTSRQSNDKFSRSNSVKEVDKKKCFNLKSFITHTSSASRAKTVASKEKSDTFPLNQKPRYQQSSANNSSKQSAPLKIQQSGDPVIIDSTKRVLEWQLKNEDVILKENKIKEQKIYQTISNHGTGTSKKKKSNPFTVSIFACCSAPGKRKPDVNMAVLTPVSNRNTFPKTTPNQSREIDLYDSIDGTLPTPTGVSKQKTSHPVSARINSSSHVVHISPKTRANSHSTRITYQTNNSRKTSPSNDIYATVNKSTKKDSKSPKVSSGASHDHVKKYRF